MPDPTSPPAADPPDGIDRATPGVDAISGRRERTDGPGERPHEPDHRGRGVTAEVGGDVYADATRELSEPELQPEQAARDGDREAERVADGDPDIAYGADRPASGEAGHAVDADDPGGGTARIGDDAPR